MVNRSEPIYREIIKLKKDQAFAVFDFDNTVIFNDITEATLLYLSENNLFRDKNLVEASLESYSRAVYKKYHELLDAGEIKVAYRLAIKILSGFFENEIEALVKEVLESVGKDIKIRVEVIELVNFLKSKDVDVWIISASPEILVWQAMKNFNIKANLIGVKNIIIDGKITDGIEEPIPMFEGKVDCIRKYIGDGKKPLLGIGDSNNDLAMIEYSEIKVVVDRQNSLAEKAKQNNWFLL